MALVDAPTLQAEARQPCSLLGFGPVLVWDFTESKSSRPWHVFWEAGANAPQVAISSRLNICGRGIGAVIASAVSPAPIREPPN